MENKNYFKKINNLKYILHKYSKLNNLNKNNLYLNILDIELEIKNKSNEIYKTYSCKDLKNKDLKKDIIYNENISNLNCYYEFEILEKKLNVNFDNFSLAINKNKTELYLISKIDFKIENFNKFKLELNNFLLINNVCPYYNIINYSYFNNKTILKGENFCIIKNKEFIETEKPNIKLLFKNNTKKITEAKKGDLLIECFLGKEEEITRTVTGNILIPNKIEEFEEIKIDFSPLEIREEKKENYINYYANKNGFIHYDEKQNILKINNYLEKKVLSKKYYNESSFGKEQDNNIFLNLVENNASLDNIQSGMEVNAKNLHIKGNVGSNVVINSENVNIEQTLHNTSIITGAEFCKIKYCKGKVNSKIIEVYELYNGVINSRISKINFSVSSEISSKSTRIGNLHSNNIIHIIEECNIDKVTGNNNKFIFPINDFSLLFQKIQMQRNKLENIIEKTSLLVINSNKIKREISFLIEQKKKEERNEFDINEKLVIKKYKDLLKKIEELKKVEIIEEKKIKGIEKEIGIKEKQIKNMLLISKNGFGKNNFIGVKELDKEIKYVIIPDYAKRIQYNYNIKNFIFESTI